MSANEPAPAKPGQTPDSAFSFSFAIALGLILFIAGLVISLTLGGGSSIGLVFGIPLLLAGVVLPLIMMRGLLTTKDVSGPCPYCSAPLKTSDATIQLRCTACQGVVAVRDEKFYTVEKSA